MHFSIEKAKNAQLKLAGKVIRENKVKDFRYIVGLDVAYSNGKGVGVAVIMDRDNNIIDTGIKVLDVKVPYIPGLLAFREFPCMYGALKNVKKNFDIILVNGQGLAHPRRFGIACHIGILTNKPTIGVARKRLYGREVKVNENLYQIINGEEIIGAVLKMESFKIYISIGHMISLRESITIVKEFMKGHSLPEPIYNAHIIATERAKNIKHNFNPQQTHLDLI
ncbi:MAG: endonuclease V [Candidatus Methanomethylicia archaeon]